MPKVLATVRILLAVCCLHAAQAQVLSSGENSAGSGMEQGGTLVGVARRVHPALATRLNSPAVMDDDEQGSALPAQVLFAPGSARLTASATRVLDHLGQSLSTGPLAGERLRIEGHADGQGPSDANRDIAERRAMAVAAYLEQNFAINPNRLQCIGQGSAAPIQRIVVIVALTSG